MDANKRLYFIPIIARALQRDDQKRAMQEAFDEIHALGNQREYKEGFHQFLDFINASLELPLEEPEHKIQLIRDAIHQLIYDLATGKFLGDEQQRDTLIANLRSVPDWNAEYERIKKEAQDFLAPETPIEVEVLKGDRVIGSFPISKTPAAIGSVTPGSYTVQFSNGRVLWEGDFSRKDLIWTFAFPGKDLAMAAETESRRQKPTRTITLLDGELTMQVFAGLESGEIRLKSEKDS